ncbi:MAG: sigma-70 family RNA polymerase sigma factor, partial [Candidatus Poribacteria bacterium]
MRTEDGYIIHKCLNGEKEAFGFLVDKYKASVYAFAYSKLRNYHDAEDITQEVFIKAYEKLSTLKRWDSFLAWLYSITSNLCKNFIRSKSNRPDREFIGEQEASILTIPAMNSYRERMARESLYEALDALPDMYREVLTLCYLGGMNCNEIAKFLGKSPSAIRQRLSRARTFLKKEMLDTIGATFERKRLQPSFTFRIIEMVKQMRIYPSSPYKPFLPLGFSALTGIILTLLMFSPSIISLTSLDRRLSPEPPGKTMVMEVGEIPVDILEFSAISFLSGERGDGDNGVTFQFTNLQNPSAPTLAASMGEKGKWTRKSEMPTKRARFSTSVVNGKIYAIGGIDGGVDWNATYSIVEEYTPSTDTWTRKADMPTKRWAFSTSVVNGKIYAIGGMTGGWGSSLASMVEEYNPATNTWKKKSKMPTPRVFLSTSVVNGKIYVIGGHSRQGDLSTVEEYDPATNTWTKKADMPTPRVGLSTGVVNGKIYAIGGWGAPSTVEEYDPATD